MVEAAGVEPVAPPIFLWDTLGIPRRKRQGSGLALPFISCRHYIDTMLEFCLTGGKIEALKMRDFHTKSAIDSNNLQV